MPATVYLLNAPVITAFGVWRFDGPLALNEVKAHLSPGFVSSVGHQATADFLSGLLPVDCPFNRSRIVMQPGDTAVVFQLLCSLPEGKLLGPEELRGLSYQFCLLQYQPVSRPFGV